jgi:ArsR family transcriptional regulator
VDTRTAARRLEALGNPTRLKIYRLPVRAGEEGAIVGGIQTRLGIPASTLSHHIACLVKAGLVTQERTGRSLVCRAEYGRMHALLDYLVANCCEGLDPADVRQRRV